MRVFWDVQWLNRDGQWIGYRPTMNEEEARALYANVTCHRPITERHRLVKLVTTTIVMEQRSDG
jgi:hypothetical protein